MIPSLLWRCPLCAEPEALTHRRPFLRPELVSCAACGARWRVRRVPGDDFYLRLEKRSVAHPLPAGQEHSLAAWYDRMKSGIHLEPVSNPQIGLQPGESLYLASREAQLWTAVEEPLASGGTAHNPAQISPSGEDLATLAGNGQIFLTSQRLVWRSGTDCQEYALSHIQGAYAIATLGWAVAVGMRLVFFRFLHESPLKWTTYFSLVAAQVQAEYGRRIPCSHW